MNSAKVLDDTVAGGGLAAVDLQASSVTQSEIATDGVAALEIQDNSIDSGEIIDFSLTNQDVGVLFAQVNADGTVANSSGGVTVTKVGVGTYAVDYARNISSCAFVTTQGEAGAGGAGGAITGNTDRSGTSRPRSRPRGRTRTHSQTAPSSSWWSARAAEPDKRTSKRTGRLFSRPVFRGHSGTRHLGAAYATR